MTLNIEYVSSCTKRFLELLDEYNVHITFFVIVEYHHYFPEIVANIHE